MHIAVPAVNGGEDQRVRHPAVPGARISQQTHPAEVDLAFGARLAVGHPHRHAAPPAPAVLQHLQRIPVQRPLWHHHPAAGQQFPAFTTVRP